MEIIAIIVMILSDLFESVIDVLGEVFGHLFGFLSNIVDAIKLAIKKKEVKKSEKIEVVYRYDDKKEKPPHEDKIFCSFCGAQNRRDAKYCNECGRSLHDISLDASGKTIQMVCKSCNGRMDYDKGSQRFVCPYCGDSELYIENDAVTIERIRSEANRELESERLNLERSRIELEYEKEKNRISLEKLRHRAERTSAIKKDIIPIIPHLIIVCIWGISLLVMIPKCAVDLDSAGTNGMQLVYIVVLIAGAIILPHILSCRSVLPVIVTMLWIVLSILLIIPRTKVDLDNTGTNTFQLLLIVEIICSVILLVRTFKRRSV